MNPRNIVICGIFCICALSLKGQLYSDYARIYATNPPGNDYVGIGIPHPLEKLDVSGNIKATGILKCSMITTTYGSNYLSLFPQSDYACFNTTCSGFLFNKPIELNYTNGTYVSNKNGDLSIKAGINPSVSLTLHSSDIYIESSRSLNIAFNTWLGFFSPVHTHGYPQNDAPRLAMTHNETHGFIDYQDNLYFRPNSLDECSLVCYGDGTVGIGFHTGYNAHEYKVPVGFKFAVNGGIICKEVKVVGNIPDADFVFDSDYKLMKLPELEVFILENNHLPGIPSAADFTANGYKLGDMDKMLLQKIEELTLYVIELKKENEELKQLICTSNQ